MKPSVGEIDSQAMRPSRSSREAVRPRNSGPCLTRTHRCLSIDAMRVGPLIVLLVAAASALSACEPQPPKPKTADVQIAISTKGA